MQVALNKDGARQTVASLKRVILAALFTKKLQRTQLRGHEGFRICFVFVVVQVAL